MKHKHILLRDYPVLMVQEKKSISVIISSPDIEIGDKFTIEQESDRHEEFEVTEILHQRPAIISEGGKYPRLENPISCKFNYKKTGEILTYQEIKEKLIQL